MAYPALNTERDMINLIRHDAWMMDLLNVVQSLNLPDWWICAGFIRSKVWDTLHGFEQRTTLPDIDVIYFDRKTKTEDHEKRAEQKLLSMRPDEPWSVKNEARMHLLSHSTPYTSSTDAIAKFPETATALGIKQDMNNQLILAAPHGINDLINLTINPTPYFKENKTRMEIYEKRIEQKNWPSLWYKVAVQHMK